MFLSLLLIKEESCGSAHAAVHAASPLVRDSNKIAEGSGGLAWQVRALLTAYVAEYQRKLILMQQKSAELVSTTTRPLMGLLPHVAATALLVAYVATCLGAFLQGSYHVSN